MAFVGMTATLVGALIVLPSGALTPKVVPSEAKLDLAADERVRNLSSHGVVASSQFRTQAARGSGAGAGDSGR